MSGFPIFDPKVVTHDLEFVRRGKIPPHASGLPQAYKLHPKLPKPGGIQLTVRVDPHGHEDGVPVHPPRLAPQLPSSPNLVLLVAITFPEGHIVLDLQLAGGLRDLALTGSSPADVGDLGQVEAASLAQRIIIDKPNRHDVSLFYIPRHV